MRRYPMPTRRVRQGGQMMMILALMATVIFGGVALAVDLGVQTHHRRSLQNASDMAALAAARDLPGTGSLLTAQQSAANDAVQALTNEGIWSGGGTPANNGCGGRAIAGYCFTATFTLSDGTYTVSFSTPPLTPRNTSTSPQTTYMAANYAEVDLRETSANAFGSFVGQPQGTAGSHSVAYHWGPGGSFGFALYAQTQVATGNQVEQVAGDIYIGTSYAPQSLGQAALCANYVAPGGPGGHVVFGAPQPPTGAGATIPSVNYAYNAGAGCPSGGGQLYAQAPAPDCPAGGFYWDTTTSLCIANPPIQPPVFPEPAMTSGPAQLPAACTITSATSPGVYEVNPASSCGSSITVDLSGGPVNCVSLVIDAGATVTLAGATQTTPGNPPAPAVMTSFGDPSCPSSASGEGSAANRTVAWAAPSSAVVLEDTASPGCCRLYQLTGAAYMPSGTMKARKNAAIEVTGQTIVYNWDVQSGNHPNPLVTFAPNVDPQIPEVLRLVE